MYYPELCQYATGHDVTFFGNNCSLTFRDICSCLRVQKELRVSITDLVLKLIGLLLESRTRCSSWIKHGFISERSYHVDIMAALLFRKRVDCFHCIGRLIYFIIKNVWTYAKKDIYDLSDYAAHCFYIFALFFSLFFIDAKLWFKMFRHSKHHCLKSIYSISKHLPELISCLIFKIPNIMEWNFYFSIKNCFIVALLADRP